MWVGYMVNRVLKLSMSFASVKLVCWSGIFLNRLSDHRQHILLLKVRLEVARISWPDVVQPIDQECLQMRIVDVQSTSVSPRCSQAK